MRLTGRFCQWQLKTAHFFGGGRAAPHQDVEPGSATSAPSSGIPAASPAVRQNIANSPHFVAHFSDGFCQHTGT